MQISKNLGLDSNKIKKDLENETDRKKIELEEWSYRDLGIAGVPTYIINDSMIVTGAQSSDTFVKLFNKISQKEK